MTGERAIEVHRTLLACTKRQHTPRCNRQCTSCDLLLSQKDVREALETSIQVMKYVKAKKERAEL